jgi:hypothetical protein
MTILLPPGTRKGGNSKGDYERKCARRKERSENRMFLKDLAGKN